MDRAAILLLAAGASTRMRGADKLLQDIDGEPLLRRQARAMSGLGCRVIVALAPGHPARRAALAGLEVEIAEVPDASMGMSASIRAGVRAAGAAGGLAILPVDMPEISGSDMAQLLKVFVAAGGSRIVRAGAADDTPGHPVIFPARLFGALARLGGDHGARRVLQGETVIALALPGRRALIDLDTPEDWAAWRAGRHTGP